MRFSHKKPLDDPEADIYFLTPGECELMPAHCFTLYVTEELKPEQIQDIIEQIPAEALMVDYGHNTSWASHGLQSKVVLEEQVGSEWAQIKQFLHNRQLPVGDLLNAEQHDVEILDDALDSLLGISHQFLRIANEFQRTLELSRPLRVSRTLRKQYDIVVLLAYRVQALSPGAFTQHFLETYNEDDTFFLYDIGRQAVPSSDSLQEAINCHLKAGRANIAASLQQIALGDQLKTAAL